MDTHEAAAWIRTFCKQFTGRGVPVKCQVDEGGNPGVIDTLKKDEDGSIAYTGVSFGAAALDKEHHVNRRCEMLWAVREAVQRGNTVADLWIACEGEAVERLVSQASAIRYKWDSKLRPAVESKDEMQSRNLPSPDELDCVALTFAQGETGLGYIGVL